LSGSQLSSAAGKDTIVKVLVIGDIIGRPGRRVVKQYLPQRKTAGELDFVIANGENAAGGVGLTPEVAAELLSYGIDVITGGNHIWANKEVFKIIDSNERLLRPANYPVGMGVPGRGAALYTAEGGFQIAVLNLVGRVFMGNFDCPFRVGRLEVERLRHQTSIIVVDFHAEATSEKIALGWFFDGDVSAVVGTHTHVQTADERILPQGTAYITDAGMTGPFDSVIGVKKEPVIEAMQKLLPVRHVVATGDVRLCAVLIEIDPLSGRATSIKRISYPYAASKEELETG
jgi:metallophosphoesterase (TIGR00282 family)